MKNLYSVVRKKLAPPQISMKRILLNTDFPLYNSLKMKLCYTNSFTENTCIIPKSYNGVQHSSFSQLGNSSISVTQVVKSQNML